MFDEHYAARAVKFIRGLKHTKGEWYGQPFNLQPWQEEKLLRPLFGTLGRDGMRQYRSVYVEIPRKNGKSELAAAIALYMLFADGEPGAEVYSAAAERNQAALVFNAAACMVRQSPTLMKNCKILDSVKRIVFHKKNSFYQALSADARTKHGFNAHAIIYDELHCAPNRELWDALAMSMGARRQPLMMAITTAGWDRSSICWEKHEYARRVAAGEIKDSTFLPLIYGAAPEEDWTDEKVWAKANPNYGISPSKKFLKSEFKAAREIPAAENAFRRYYLDQWTSQDVRWIPMEHWDGCPSEKNDLDELEYETCFGGLDLSATRDLTSFALYFPGPRVVLSWSWIPEEAAVTKERVDHVPYLRWMKEKYVCATPGEAVDYDFVRSKIRDLLSFFKGFKMLGYDRWNAMQLLMQMEQEDGIPVVEIRQGFATLSPASKELERLVVSRELRHQGNPLLRWAAENVMVRRDENDNIRPVKSQETGRIDPLVALIIAIAARQQTEGLDLDSVYEDRGMIVL